MLTDVKKRTGEVGGQLVEQNAVQLGHVVPPRERASKALAFGRFVEAIVEEEAEFLRPRSVLIVHGEET